MDISNLSKDARIEIVEKVRVLHPELMEGLEKMNECRIEGLSASEPQSMIVTGMSGTGKTTLKEIFVSEYDKNQNSKTQKLIISENVPSPATAKTVVTNLLRKSGDPFPESGTIGNMTKRFTDRVQKLGIQLIILDEVQHFLHNGREKKEYYKIADWFKSLMNETHVPFVLFGLTDATQILTSNNQLDDRVSIRHQLNPFKYDTEDEKNDFKRLLYEFDRQLPFRVPSNLADFSNHLYFASDGRMRMLTMLLRKAARIAIKQEHDKIELIDFANAFNFYKYKKDKNPFIYEDFSLGANINITA